MGSKIQFIDTGVIVGNAEGYAGEGGTADHAWRTGAISSARSAVGVGVLRDCSGTLSEYAKKTAAAKPLGLTRLVIATSDKKRVLFVSKLLHMRWPISKLIWSLRGLPTDGLTVAWLVYVTRAKEWTKAVIKALTGAPAAPATLLTGNGELKLANAIIATDNSPVDVYRSHLLTPGDWRHNLNQGSRSTPGDVAKWTIDAATPQDVLEWCVKPGNFGQRLIRQVTDSDKGTSDDAATGDALVDP
ncbi:Hypothetical protein A7982_11584 [Minicystis rosea]|nr:Hypothetical protein A7982_11584 [Minicystis rosea]